MVDTHTRRLWPQTLPTHGVGLLLCLALGTAGSEAAPMTYPPTRQEPVVDHYGTVEVTDPYRWLEDGDSQEVKEWIVAQGDYTRAWLDPLPGRETLRTQYEALWQYSANFSPQLAGDRLFWSRREQLENQPKVHTATWAQGFESGTILLDPNTWSEDGTVALDWQQPSKDGSLIAYGVSEGGTERSTLHLIRADGTSAAEEVIPNTRASSVAWLPDNTGFYYSRLPEKGTVPEGEDQFYRHIYFHEIGTDPASDPLIFGGELPKETWIDASTSTDYSTLFISTSIDWAKNDLYMKHLRSPDKSRFIPLAVGLDGQTGADVADDRLILMTNVGHPRFHILSAPLSEPDNRTEIIPEGAGVIQNFVVVGERIVVSTLENAYSHLRVYALDGTLEREITLPTLGTASGLVAHPATNEVMFSFTSFTFAPAIMTAEVATGATTIRDQLAIPLDWERYQVRQEWATSKDGTLVPMFIVSLKGIALDGNNPTIMSGYGGFNNSETPYFSRGILPWLEAGGVWVDTNLRGGGEFGAEWHEAGRLERKQNVFDDFIACAEHLFAAGYTNPKKLALSGGSNGGLLVGAVMVQRPDLAQAVICAVPLLDMLRYQYFLLGRLWVPEYGDSEVPEQFPFLYAYSPYQHVQEGVQYPAVLFMSGDQDSRVDPLHARKMAALMQRDTASDRPILLRVEYKAGHGQGTPLSKAFDEMIDQYTFLAQQLGMANFPVASPLLAADTVSAEG